MKSAQEIAIIVDMGGWIFLFMGMAFFSGANAGTSPSPVQHESKKEDEQTLVAPGAGLSLMLPKAYTLKVREPYVGPAYRFEFEATNRSPPYLQEMLIFTEDSLKKALKKQTACGAPFAEGGGDGGDPDPKGDLERFYRLKKSFRAQSKKPTRLTRKFGDKRWFFENEECLGDSCRLRYYRTFIGDRLVTVSVIGWPPASFSDAKADAEFSKLSIKP